MMVAALTVVGLLLITPYIRRLVRERRALTSLKAFERDGREIRDIVGAFDGMLASDRYISNFEHTKWLNTTSKFKPLLDTDIAVIARDGAFAAFAVRLQKYVRGGRELLDRHNDAVCKKEAELLSGLLDTRAMRKNDEQLLAAVSEEDNTLVVAGAGTGKTTTLLGKLCYLIDRLGVAPKDILVLSFTQKVVEELKQRIDEKFPEPGIDIRTFHSFGLSVLHQVIAAKPEVLDEKDRKGWLGNEFEKLLLQDAKYLRAAVHYFAYHLQYEDTDKRFKTLDEYYRHLRAERVLTMRKEFVKSHQEAMIANCLFLNGVNYEYEKPYEYATADSAHRQYKPDFYLPDYGIYIEHFGVDRAGNVRFSENESQNKLASIKYQEAMKWKRALHTNMQTTLIETYSYQFSERTWEAELAKQLTASGVRLSERPLSEILRTLQDSDQIRAIIDIFATFLDLAKSNHYSEGDLAAIIRRKNYPRELAFGDLFLPLFRKYEAYLAISGKIDFHDMLNRASEFIEEGRFIGSYRYILIDEFQDFSVSKDHMVRALCKQNASVKLFCVGDDWQSIYRFAGADVSLMTHFATYHGYTRDLKLVCTNRFDKKLAKITNEFIQKNPYQIKKDIVAREELPDDPLHILKAKSDADEAVIVEHLLAEMDAEADQSGKHLGVYLLGRYKFNEPPGLRDWKKRFAHLKLKFVTAHSSKGLEADRVIVLNVVAGRHGFPSQIADDPILSLVMRSDETYPHAEERRLMYVALTRTRSKVYVITQRDKESPFIGELESDLKQAASQQNTMRCPLCSGEVVERKSKYGPFLACKNYPDCTWKKGLRGSRSRSAWQT